MNSILEILYWEAGLNVEKIGGVVGGEGKCGHTEIQLLARERETKFRYYVSKERSY